MNLVLYVIGLLILLLFHQKKYCAYIAIILMTLICFFSPDIADMQEYEVEYIAIGQGSETHFLGIGWLYLCKLGNLFHLSYLMFKTILYCGSLFLFHFALTRLSNKPQIAFAFYFCFPALMDLIQIRSFVALAICMLGFIFFFKEKWWNKIIYAGLILLASSIHNSYLFYLVFLFAPLFHKKNGTIIAIILVCVVSLIGVICYPYIPEILYRILPESQHERIEFYFSGWHISYLAFIIYALFFALQVGIYEVAIQMIKKNPKDAEEDAKMIEKNRRFQMVAILSCLTLPLVYCSSDFLRIQRGLIALNYALYAEDLFLLKENHLKLEKVPLKLDYFVTVLLLGSVAGFLIYINGEYVWEILW